MRYQEIQDTNEAMSQRTQEFDKLKILNEETIYKLSTARTRKVAAQAEINELDLNLKKNQELLSNQIKRVQEAEVDQLERNNRMQAQQARVKEVDNEISLQTEELNRKEADFQLTRKHQEEEQQRHKVLQSRIEESHDKTQVERRMIRQEEAREKEIATQLA